MVLVLASRHSSRLKLFKTREAYLAVKRGWNNSLVLGNRRECKEETTVHLKSSWCLMTIAIVMDVGNHCIES
jgi:hypothetical protein